METKQILFYLIIAVLVYLIYNFFFKDHTVVDLQGMHNAKVNFPIDSKSLPSSGGSNDYTFSVWIYVNTWSYKYGKPKIILRRSTSGSGGGEPIPEIFLDENSNDLRIKLATYSSGNSGAKGNDDECNIKNIPLQKWVHILMSVNGRTNDVYIDGKLVKTCMLNGVAMLDKLGKLDLCPDGGFSGYTSKLRYYARAVNPREAYEIYKEGFSDSWLGESASKYKLKLAFFSDGSEMNSWSI
jgi:hypothetical protein